MLNRLFLSASTVNVYSTLNSDFSSLRFSYRRVCWIQPRLNSRNQLWCFPWWLSWWRVCLQRRRLVFSPWIRKMPWRRKWQPTPVFFPGEFHWLQSAMVHGVTKSRTRLGDYVFPHPSYPQEFLVSLLVNFVWDWYSKKMPQVNKNLHFFRKQCAQLLGHLVKDTDQFCIQTQQT